MDVQLASTYSFQTNTLVRLADILSADEALREFGNFYFMASNLLFAGGGNKQRQSLRSSVSLRYWRSSTSRFKG